MTLCGYTDKKYYSPQGLGVSDDILKITFYPSGYKLLNNDIFVWNKKLPSSEHMKSLGYFTLHGLRFMTFDYQGTQEDIETEIASLQNDKPLLSNRDMIIILILAIIGSLVYLSL